MEDLSEYALMTEAYDFAVGYDACKGKLLQAKRVLEPKETVLVEVPLAAWPIGASVPLAQSSFCENCLKLKPFHASSPAPLSAFALAPSSPALPLPVSSPEADAQGAGADSPHTPSPAPDFFGSPPYSLLGRDTPAPETRPTGAAAGGLEASLPPPPSSPASRLASAAALSAEASPPLFASAASSASGASSSASPSPSAVEEAEEACELTLQGVQCWFCSPRCLAIALGGDTLISVHKALPAASQTHEARAVSAAVEASLDGGGFAGREETRGRRKRRGDEGADSRGAEPAYAAPGAEKLVGGWMSVLQPPALRQLRERDQCAASPSSANPLPLEALARVIARIAAQTRALLVSHPGLSLEEAFCASSRAFQRLAVPSPSGGQGGFDVSSFAETLDVEQRFLTAILHKPLHDTVGEEAATLLLNRDTLLHLKCALAVNSQAVNIWGASTSGALMVLRGGGVYTLHACLNHSCEPNCAVASWGQEGEGSTLTVSTRRRVDAGEELTVSYVDETLPAARRRQLLHATYGFLCSCSRCIRESADAPPASPGSTGPQTGEPATQGEDPLESEM
ncbi:putative histone lysine methyltransferase, SET [Besnoitia besnoiti]|uniref:Putative histone lysine methyltransferase, SET n=1 Tax=Besnoitia besnoiti TaxID=94643 RepID=A0A2A9MNK2_BESBE|nr:putative histone lysine methyltransferase, SET [Besnoitia besnoiti]PFH37806.1 putative histone lysine methyltransferase, SET [Besnoitia besnoiti]